MNIFLIGPKAGCLVNGQEELVLHLLVGLVGRQVDPVETCVAPGEIVWDSPLLNAKVPWTIAP